MENEYNYVFTFLFSVRRSKYVLVFKLCLKFDNCV